MHALYNGTTFRGSYRQEHIRPLVVDLETWRRAERAKFSRHADPAKAMEHMLKRWFAFTRFLDDGRICITNNAVERALRSITLARRKSSWLDYWRTPWIQYTALCTLTVSGKIEETQSFEHT